MTEPITRHQDSEDRGRIMIPAGAPPADPATCGGLTLAVALSLRGSLIRPATWNSCDTTSISQKPAAPDDAGADPQPPGGQQVGQEVVADHAGQVDDVPGDDVGDRDELVAGSLPGDGEAGPVRAGAGPGAGRVGYRSAQQLVDHEQGGTGATQAGSLHVYLPHLAEITTAFLAAIAQRVKTSPA